MIKSQQLYNLFKKKKINFFVGVPDSILKNFLTYISKIKKIKHITAVNEGSAVALAIGNYLSSKKIGLVYLQNSGLGNAINPLISIAEKTVYSIPLILLIGWRGAPGQTDEPQHMAKGKITKNLLSSLNIKNITVNSPKDFKKVEKLIIYSKKNKSPVALLITNKTFYEEKKDEKIHLNHSILRSSFIINFLKEISQKDKIISTTGFTSRELHQLRKMYQLKKGKDFYMVGGMGHSAGVTLGCSLKSNSRVICLDGDGSLLMHMGSLATVAKYGKKNYKYILLNNNAHESVGGQSTNSNNINFKKFSESLGFKNYFLINKKKNLRSILKVFLKSDGPSFLEVLIRNESISNLTRPKNFDEIINDFIK